MASKFFPVWKEIMCMNGMPIIFSVGGFDPRTHNLLWRMDIALDALPKGHMLEEAVNDAGWELTRNVYMTYLTSQVPDDIVWVGKVVGSISSN